MHVVLKGQRINDRLGSSVRRDKRKQGRKRRKYELMQERRGVSTDRLSPGKR